MFAPFALFGISFVWHPDHNINSCKQLYISKASCLVFELWIPKDVCALPFPSHTFAPSSGIPILAVPLHPHHQGMVWRWSREPRLGLDFNHDD